MPTPAANDVLHHTWSGAEALYLSAAKINGSDGNVQRILPHSPPTPRLIIGSDQLTLGGGGSYEHHNRATAAVAHMRDREFVL